MASLSAVQAPPVISCEILKEENTRSFGLKDLLSLKDVKLLVSVAEQNADVESFNLRPYSEEKLGYLSTHLRLTVKLAGSHRMLFFFVKVIPYEDPLQEEYIADSGIFQQEANFYKKIAPELRKGFHGEPWAPECYAVRENFMVFEDLSAKDNRYTLREKLFNEDLVMSGLSTLARLHAASLLAENRLRRPLDELFPRAFEEKAFSRSGRRNEWYEAGVRLAETIAERLGANPTVVRSTIDEVYKAIEKSTTKPNVVSHGDLWANNLMFSDDDPPRCLLVDFQLLRYCPPAHDVAQFLFLSTSRTFREKRERDMLRHYHRVLSETLAAHEYPKKRSPSFQDICQGYEEQRIGGIATAVLYYPTVLQDGKTSAKVMNDPAVFERYYFRDRREVVQAIMKEDPVYRRRIEEAVAELVELGENIQQLPKPT